MLFNSIEFLIFFPIVTIIHFAIPYRFRWILLLGASYYFYMSWKPEYIILILLSTIIDYFASKQMDKTPIRSKRRKYLILSLCSNLGMLFIFKYFNFFSSSLQGIMAQIGIDYNPPVLEVLLPVGISFYTFQTLSYTIDVYRGRQKPEAHFGIFSLYVAFFPQLVAGPIERSTRLLPQFRKQHNIDYQRITDGLKLMAWGFFKKLVIADRLATTVNNVYNNPTEYTGIPLIVATFFFAIQIYCDFSGYSDIAIGAAKVLGYNLMENFRQPYFSKSVREFWQRWHISLSTWFRDYFYIPLGGNRAVKWRWYFNLMAVFVVSGLWHGASWTFVIWGALHGSFLIISIWATGLRKKILSNSKLQNFPILLNITQILGTFLLVSFAWIFFRANSISDALYIVSHLFVDIQFKTGYGMDVGGSYELAIAILSIAVLIFVDFMQTREATKRFLSGSPIWVRWPAYYALIFSILIFGKFGITEFIYFQF